MDLADGAAAGAELGQAYGGCGPSMLTLANWKLRVMADEPTTATRSEVFASDHDDVIAL